jgi:hypothetical protein
MCPNARLAAPHHYLTRSTADPIAPQSPGGPLRVNCVGTSAQRVRPLYRREETFLLPIVG